MAKSLSVYDDELQDISELSYISNGPVNLRTPAHAFNHS